MKTNLKLILTLAAAVALGGGRCVAADEVTLTGEGTCAKCGLHETKACQNVIQVEKDGKKTTYYLAQNDVSKGFHKHLCSDSEQIKVTGTVEQKDGKLVLTPSKIEEVK
jgi:Family of unknown function (DUF6370)